MSMAQNANTFFFFLTQCVRIRHNDCLSCVDYNNKSPKYGHELGIKGNSQIFFKKTVTLLIIQTPLWFIDGVCSYLAQQLSMVCRV